MLALPVRRVACRPLRRGSVEALLGDPARIYVGGRDVDGTVGVDVVDGRGVLRDRLWGDGPMEVAVALLRDATGHAPRPATAGAFASEVLERLPNEGFVLTSSEICAWLLLRAIERAA
jgi:hypothetical protein